MLVVQQADCEKIMYEVPVFRGQRGPPLVYVPKRCTSPHICTTTNMILINSSNIINFTVYYFTLTDITSSWYYYSTSNSYTTFRIAYHRVPKRPDAEFEKTVKCRPYQSCLPVRLIKNVFHRPNSNHT